MEQSRRWNVAAEIALSTSLAAIVWFLYRRVLRLWWTWDDAYLLHTTLLHHASDALLAPALWQGMPNLLFTPFLLLSYKGELALFGLTPSLWHGIELILVAVAAMSIYLSLRLYLSPWTSWFGALLFVVSTPACTLASELMVMHYSESIALGACALALFVVALRKKSLALVVLSALFYFLAMLAKEIAVPLAGLLLVLPERDARMRLRYLTGHGLAIAAYAIWRFEMLGTLLGGYGWAITPASAPRLLAGVPLALGRAFAGPNAAAGAALLIVTAAGVVAALWGPRNIGAALLGLVLAVGPIIPVAREMQLRFTVMPWLAWSTLFVIGCESLALRHRWARTTLLVAAAVLAIVVNRQEWARQWRIEDRMSAEGRFFLDLGADSAMRHPVIPPAAMGELRWLKEEHLGRTRGSGWFYDDLALCTGTLTGRRIWEYSPEGHGVVEITRAIPRISGRYCSSIRPTAPLRAEFRYRDETLFWRFGPYADGRYAVVMADGLQAFDVPREDGFRLRGLTGIALRVRYEAPSGWVTYSPEITLDFRHRPDTQWTR